MTRETHSTTHHGSAFRLARAMWRRRKWLAMLAFIAPFSAAVSLVMAMPDLYRAEATVLVKQDQVPENTAGPSAGELESRLQAISEEILSRARLQGLIDRFDLYPKLRKHASPEAVIERMRRDIRLERKEVALRWGYGATVAFTLSYQGWEPRTVARVVNTLASVYVEENEKLRRRIAGTQVAGGVDVLTKLKRELVELRARFSDKYPDVIRLKTEIAALERQRQETGRTRAALAAETALRQELEEIEKKEQRLQKAIAAIPPWSENVLTREQDLERLRREYDATRELGVSVRKRYEEARLAGTSERQGREQFRILDPALPPSEPVAPGRARLMLMGLILALGMAGVAVFLAEQFDTSFHRLDELWAFTNLPILTSVPRIVTQADSWRSRLRFGFVSVLAVSGLALLVRASFLVGSSGEQLVWILAHRGT